MKKIFSNISKSTVFLIISSVSFIVIICFLIIAETPNCKVESSEDIGVVTNVLEIPTSFNDFRRMQIIVENNSNDFDGESGTYFIKGVANVRNKDKVSLVKTTCGSKIKFGTFEKLFGTFEYSK